MPKISGSATIGLGRIKDYALSDADLRKILGDDIKILTYPELENLHSADDLFDSKGRCIILFLIQGPTSGHWCCLMNKKNGIYFFDPYGEAPDEQQECLPQSKLAQLDMDKPFLTKLLRESGRPVYYNTYPYQKDKSGINTCGRWCAVRLLYADKSDEYFNKVVKKANDAGLSNDDFVGALCANVLGR